MPNDQLFVTALPNGIIGNQLRLSLYLTPALNQNMLMEPFATWPDHAQHLKWLVSFFTFDTHAPLATNLPTSVDPDALYNGNPDYNLTLWQEIFRGVKPPGKRTGHNHLHRTWRLSHNISHLHSLHQLDRYAHAISQVLRRRNATSASVQTLASATTPPILFLHPKYQSDIAQQYDDLDKAQVLLSNLLMGITPMVRGIVQTRVQYGQPKLEEFGGAPLSAVALSALYIACLQSAVPLGTMDITVTNAVATIRSWFAGGTFSVSYPDIDTVLEYVQMLIFHRRNQPCPDSEIKQPDFHQLLGLVQNYPAILRPLGLVFDLLVPMPARVTGHCSVRAFLDPSDSYSSTLSMQLDVGQLPYTQCVIDTDFYAFARTPRGLIQSGLLNLNWKHTDGSIRFTLVPENADGQVMKRTQQINNSARADEYTTSAPTGSETAMLSGSGGTTATPTANAGADAFPASSTVGLALFDIDRLAQLEQTAQQVADTNDMNPVAPPNDVFAEDLVRGYRVDVLYRQQFYSLCRRQSTYRIFTARTDQQIDTWSPLTKVEQFADEGYLTFSATQSQIDPIGMDTSANSQTQIHQAVFTWTGWSLSVPQPQLPLMNPPSTTSTDTASKHQTVRPSFTLAPGTLLPPLRFNTDYQVRCRVADLAGNGPHPDIDPNNVAYSSLTLAPSPQFSRQEPIRAPHFLLLHPIDRTRQPGTHIDRMVARDQDTISARILIPPRESLRLAELSGVLTSDRLPPGAFGAQQLWVDGSFPSVACAKEKGWISGRIHRPGDNDPIFLRDRDGIAPAHPYYPDPWANYVRIEIYELTDDPSQSTFVDLKWIRITTGDVWSQRLAVRVRLVPVESGATSVTLDADAEVREGLGFEVMPTLDVKVAKGRTAVLRISSAAVESSASAEEAAPYLVHLSHLIRLQQRNPTALPSRLGTSAGRVQVQQLAQSIATNPEVAQIAPEVFLDGSADISTPSRTMTLVHAVRQPLAPPEFAPLGSPGNLQVVRAPGKPEAHVSGQLRADWLSTAKITCYAEWSDLVDDISRSQPTHVPHREVAFAVTAKDFEPDTPYPPARFRTLDGMLLEHFTDTRAHHVQYSLVASSNFTEYYAGATPDDNTYQRAGTQPVRLIVASSARPPAPSVAYIIPAFVWAETWDRRNKTWYVGRNVILRVYLERPFLVSGDRETLGVILYDPNSGVDPAQQSFASRWGADPARPITTPILRNELNEVNLCQDGLPVENSTLPDGDSVRIKPCIVEYSTDRRMWFADIPINTQHANAPFVRLALVRWQPDALTGANEARCSKAVFAEFTQISPNRWVSVQKISSSRYKFTVSGAFPANTSTPPFSMTLYKRWFALTRDMGWRNIGTIDGFTYTPPDSAGVSVWSAELETPRSTNVARYRVLLREQEFPGEQQRESFLALVNLE